MLRIVVFGTCLALGGCATTPVPVVGMDYIRADGRPMEGNPALTQQFSIDGDVCIGEVSKADMSGTILPLGGAAGVMQSINRRNESGRVMIGCMADRGYLFVRADQAGAALQLAAAANASKSQPTAASPVRR